MVEVAPGAFTVMVPLPFIWKTVVCKTFLVMVVVVVEIAKSGVVPPDKPAIARVAIGEVVPIPRLP